MTDFVYDCLLFYYQDFVLAPFMVTHASIRFYYKMMIQAMSASIHTSNYYYVLIQSVTILQNDDVNTIFVVIAGFGSRQQPLSHVWRGNVLETGTTTWTDISRWNGGRLPDIPVNAIVIEPNRPDTIYIGTDIGVFRTINGSSTWTRFSQGLPNCA